MIDVADSTEMGAVKDWRKALRAPPAYKIVNRTLRNQTQFISLVAFVGIVALILLYAYPKKAPTVSRIIKMGYNTTYPLTAPIRTKYMHTFRIGAVTDLDTNSKSGSDKYLWCAYMKKGYVSYSPTKQSVVVSWDRTEPLRLTTSFSLKGRGMELSELVVFDGRLLTFDDRTGMVFEIVDNRAIPWVVLLDGNGRELKGFKSEWATVKDEHLYVGSMGKEWTTPAGVFESHNPQYVKVMNTQGHVNHISWVKEYEKIRESLGIYWPGYMIHESGMWSSVHQRWFFLPRRCSKETYNETLDERKGCSWLISSDAHMADVRTIKIGGASETRGFSSFKFMPSTNDNVILALRTEEVDGKTASYINAFTIDGKMLMEDELFSDMKYEGLEFI